VLQRLNHIACAIIKRESQHHVSGCQLRVIDGIANFGVPQATECVGARSDSSVTFAVHARAHRSGCRYYGYENYKSMRVRASRFFTDRYAYRHSPITYLS